MAVYLEFINLIIPITNIDRVYPGGFARFKEVKAQMFQGKYWHDDHLFRDGAMSPSDIGDAAKYWTDRGLIIVEESNGRPASFKDMCVCDIMGMQYPCDWLEFDGELCCWLKGTEKGDIAGPPRFSGKL